MPSKTAKEARFMAPTLAETAYLAGIVDGEGTIYVSHRTQKRGLASYRQARIELHVCNTYLPLLYQLRDRFGGSVYVYAPTNSRCKPKGTLHWGQAATAQLLKTLLPYLVVKRAQAEIAIAYQKTRMSATAPRKLGVPHEVQLYRQRLSVELCALNRRGDPEHAIEN